MNLLQKIFLSFNIAAVITLLVIITIQDKKIKSIQPELTYKVMLDSVVREKDSLYLEFVKQSVETQRYESTLELLEEKNSSAADEFNKIYLTETR
jgi:hypothetical protein